MVEMLGVLAIIGVLTVGGIAGYSKAMHKYQLNQTMSQILQSIAATQRLYANQSGYDGVYNSNIQSIIFSGLQKDQSGYYYLLPNNAQVAVDQYYNVARLVIYYSHLGDNAFYKDCVEIVSHDWTALLGDKFSQVSTSSAANSSASLDEGLVGINIGTEAFYDDYGGLDSLNHNINQDGVYIPKKYLPLSPTQSVEYCKEGMKYSNSRISFLFR